jgi:glycosyltransferase involved in cell wall biosynthesis
VRNDPFFLIAAVMHRGKVARIIFQSSFPHESQSDNKIKGILARSIYRIAGRWVDGVVGVSPEGVKRIRSVLGRDVPSLSVPLLSDLPKYEGARAFNQKSEGTTRFVYIGSHDDARELDTVFEAIVNCMQRDVSASFHFIGATHPECARFRKLPGVEALMKAGVVEIQSPVARDEVPKILASCHVGMSLIPPSAMYIESSPTKLAEYMGAGLAVLASKGIPIQEQFVQASDGGVLVDWDVEAISDAIASLASDTARLGEMGRKCHEYAVKELQYGHYVDPLRKLILTPP